MIIITHCLHNIIDEANTHHIVIIVDMNASTSLMFVNELDLIIYIMYKKLSTIYE